MSEPNRDRLYQLLPAIYRLRDAERGESLRALLSVIEAEFQALEDDIDSLYENWFVETCDEWVVPYIGDLLRVGGIQGVTTGTFSQRARVANTVRYRRRKGTAAVLEQLARDVSGWPARAVEFFQVLETTQNVNHVRPGNVRTPDLRDADRMELLSGAFDRAAHTADVRHIDNGRGRYNVPNVGLFLWRLQGYAVTRSDARPADPAVEGGFLFDPTGRAQHLFNRPRTETEITHLAGERDVPEPLRRRPLHDELERLRQTMVDGGEPDLDYFGPHPVLRVFRGQPPEEIAPAQIEVCDLSDWRRPVTPKVYVRASDQSDVEQVIAVAVDPLLGRLTFPVGAVPSEPRVSFSFGLSGDLGGGPYNRGDSVRSWQDPSGRPATFQIGVAKDPALVAEAPEPGSIVETIGEAVEAWKAHASARAGANGLIAVMDSRTYQEELTGDDARLEVPAGARLAIVAADWTLTDDPETGLPARVLGQLGPEGLRPHLLGSVEVAGLAGTEAVGPGELIVDGLLIEGSMTVVEGDLGSLQLLHCTLVPEEGGLSVVGSGDPSKQNAGLVVRLRRTICGPISLPETVPRLLLTDGIVDAATGAGPPGSAIDAAGSDLDVHEVTVLGACSGRTLRAGNSVFRDRVHVERRQVGCVRFSYVSLDSTVPRRYRCQPAEEATADRVFPQFASVTYGKPAYAQLAPACAPEITAGADDEGEMGAWHFLAQTLRGEALRAGLDEYLRVGLEAGTFFAT